MWPQWRPTFFSHKNSGELLRAAVAIGLYIFCAPCKAAAFVIGMSGAANENEIALQVVFAQLPNFIKGFSAVKAASGRGFSSFSALKRHLGPAGSGHAWHHIVEQTPANVTRFGAQSIHNTANVVRLPNVAGSIHRKISGFYSSKQPFTGGQTVRQWLAPQSFEAQRAFGLQTIERFGGLP